MLADGCGRMYIEADTLEVFVVEAGLHRLDSPELAAVLNGSTSDPDADLDGMIGPVRR